MSCVNALVSYALPTEMHALHSSPVTHSKPPLSTTLLSHAQLWWGVFSGISQMFLLLCSLLALACSLQLSAAAVW